MYALGFLYRGAAWMNAVNAVRAGGCGPPEGRAERPAVLSRP
jgi:hypothetical protein